jgi:hypothetical protein
MFRKKGFKKFHFRKVFAFIIFTGTCSVLYTNISPYNILDKQSSQTSSLDVKEILNQLQTESIELSQKLEQKLKAKAHPYFIKSILDHKRFVSNSIAAYSEAKNCKELSDLDLGLISGLYKFYPKRNLTEKPQIVYCEVDDDGALVKEKIIDTPVSDCETKGCYPEIYKAYKKVTCSSNGSEVKKCEIFGLFSPPKLITQWGDSPCIPGKTYGYGPDGIWVRDGCKGDFLALPVANYNRFYESQGSLTGTLFLYKETDTELDIRGFACKVGSEKGVKVQLQKRLKKAGPSAPWAHHQTRWAANPVNNWKAAEMAQQQCLTGEKHPKKLFRFRVPKSLTSEFNFRVVVQSDMDGLPNRPITRTMDDSNVGDGIIWGTFLNKTGQFLHIEGYACQKGAKEPVSVDLYRLNNTVKSGQEYIETQMANHPITNLSRAQRAIAGCSTDWGGVQPRHRFKFMVPVADIDRGQNYRVMVRPHTETRLEQPLPHTRLKNNSDIFVSWNDIGPDYVYSFDVYNFESRKMIGPCLADKIVRKQTSLVFDGICRSARNQKIEFNKNLGVRICAARNWNWKDKSGVSCSKSVRLSEEGPDNIRLNIPEIIQNP